MTPSSSILAAHDLFKTYRLGRVDVPVLRGVSLSLVKGEFVAILGASGSGKSTLLHLLGGLDRPDRGKGGGGGGGGDIRYEKRALREYSSGELDRYRTQVVGFVFQFYHLLPELSVTENVTIASMVRHGMGYGGQRHEATDRAVKLLDSFGLGHRLKHRPAELSGGERQRVAIARALANDPPILLADEPTGNLDRKTGESILDALVSHRTSTGRTLVIVTHDEHVAKRADRIVRLVDGKIADQ